MIKYSDTQGTDTVSYEVEKTGFNEITELLYIDRYVKESGNSSIQTFITSRKMEILIVNTFDWKV